MHYPLMVPLLCAIVNGCTMGVDQSMMNNLNMIDLYINYFHLDADLEGLFSASVNIGSVLGGFFASQSIEIRCVGRKGGILLSCLITFVGVALQTAAQNRAMFIIARILIGIAVTVNAVAAPTYVAEMVKSQYRGFFTGIYMASWYLAAVVTTAISLGTYTIDSTWAWRSISLWQLSPSLFAITLLPFIPETPRFLVFVGREADALQVLKTYHGDGLETAVVQKEFLEIKERISLEMESQVGWIDMVRSHSNRWRLWIIFWMGIASQFTGSNIVGTYLGLFLDNSGISSTRRQIVINLTIQFCNLIFAVLGSWLTERWGRTPIIVNSTIFMGLCLFIMGTLQRFYSDGHSVAGSNALIFMVYLFSITYAFSFTPLCVSYPVEILNYSIRTKGMAFSQVVTFGSGFFNQYVLPIALSHLSWRYYMINASYNMAQAGLFYLILVEVKGLTLEEIDEKFEKPIPKS
ncbi:DEKNAAC103127 [Brettanomyces naardenensis]|uniref:DEKNAAC103127 n=1 Tax=Brettanomyces naardenensis TaxID=13370 RepID=A0A448YMM5_BRENA|nr:DEKNAAC103127 [Brettanomyces naardenensis]